MFRLFSFKHDEESQRQSNPSIEDIEKLVEQLQQNETFTHFLDVRIRNKIKNSLYQEKAQDLLKPDITQYSCGEERSQENIDKNNLPKKTSVASNLTGSSSTASSNELEDDLYSMMMMSELFSVEWFLGIISFLMQITLAGIIVSEQTKKVFFGTDMSIPIGVPYLTRTAQFLAVILAIITQNEFLCGLRTILMLPYGKKETWGKVCGIDEINCTKDVWILRIFFQIFLNQFKEE